MWDQLLEHTTVWVARSVLRGIGPARQRCSFAIAKLLRLAQSPPPLLPNEPQHPVRLSLLSPIFLVREVEAIIARISAWTVDHEARELTWNLPDTTSDQMALGV